MRFRRGVQRGGGYNSAVCDIQDMLELGFALWILIAPLNQPGAWAWTIVGGPYDDKEKCEWARTHRLDATLCVRLK